jgi:negative regulator of sigma-B (phosphoserine phosphatase)
MALNFSVLSRPKPGETRSGDAYFIARAPSSVTFAVIDALGHGEEAFKASARAREVLVRYSGAPLERILMECHEELRLTRGVAVAACRVAFNLRKMEHIGIGNVETRIYGAPAPVRPFCFNGVLGMRTEKYRVNEYPYSDGSTIVVFTDGISGEFELEAGLLAKSPREIALYLFGGFARQTDDATVLVCR